MPTFDTRLLITDLRATLKDQADRLTDLRAMPPDLLQAAPGPGRWSVLEVVGHLLVLGGHYQRRLQQVYAKEDNGLRFRERFTSGPWGERLTRAMQPRADGSIPWPMRTLGRFEPGTSPGDHHRLAELEVLLHGSDELLQRAWTRGLEGERITSTLGPIIRFKPGDAFRFTVAHQERHFLQIARTLEALAVR